MRFRHDDKMDKILLYRSEFDFDVSICKFYLRFLSVLCFSKVLLFFEDFPFFLFERKADLSWSAFASF